LPSVLGVIGLRQVGEMTLGGRFARAASIQLGDNRAAHQQVCTDLHGHQKCR
jgi:hypothetical protein